MPSGVGTSQLVRDLYKNEPTQIFEQARMLIPEISYAHFSPLDAFLESRSAQQCNVVMYLSNV
ncbi:uncharacterized protein PHALS_15183 [Plasmopara halstedii]|uniref:Uncharacterized protein n=1 Tax=Plasmopara halstedii TaxID=4781 RepID=A0A0P1B4G5_PLAHL|nr:uncharacterized protein PHALS_15183 [Plasmopara halstedii]CEG48910.1 hypothetical protein PHALS_15183 [Plasmopara halstedii]|eukprot:XP_024585279.1 hypothetical protein PHALS_15183 [Plasmopara halstedii]